MSAPKYTAAQVASAFLELVNEHGDFVSNLKLQKLLYYSQGWNLAYKGEPLFSERLEAWIHGPVCPTIYQKYKHFTFRPIELEVPPGTTLPELREHVEDVFRAYGAMSAFDLEALSHRESPWRNARGTAAPTEHCSREISHRDLWDFFSQECLKDGNQPAPTPNFKDAPSAAR